MPDGGCSRWFGRSGDFREQDGVGRSTRARSWEEAHVVHALCRCGSQRGTDAYTRWLLLIRLSRFRSTIISAWVVVKQRRLCTMDWLKLKHM